MRVCAAMFQDLYILDVVDLPQIKLSAVKEYNPCGKEDLGPPSFFSTCNCIGSESSLACVVFCLCQQVHDLKHSKRLTLFIRIQE